MPRIGLVLGGGGMVGQAYHAGVLAALEHDLGWDPRTADVVVGTSAGALTGTFVRFGVPAHDLSAWAVEAPLSVDSEATLARLSDQRRPEFPDIGARHLLSGWRLPSRQAVGRLLLRPWGFRPGALASTMMPAGRVDLLDYVDALDSVSSQSTGHPLWVCATKRDDGERVVFGRDSILGASLTEAVAASCAIPGYFAPVDIAAVEYVDGGMSSPTNADVLADEDLDVVVVVSPMSASDGEASGVDRFMRRWAHRRLDREVRILRKRGSAVVPIEPGPQAREVMGLNMMDNDRTDSVVQEAFIDTGRYTADPDVADLLGAGDRIVQRTRAG